MMPSSINLFGYHFPLYYAGYFLAFPLCVLFNGLYYRRKYNLGNMKVVLVSMLGLNLTYVGLLLSVSILRNAVVHGMNWVRVIGFVPLLWLPLAWASKTKVKKLLDFLTPSLGINNMIIHTGCIFAGCCCGFPIESYPSWLQWMAIYNNQMKAYLFPTQLCESFTCGLLALVIVLWARKKHYRTDGLAFPLYLALFGTTRFIWEFFRDNPKIAGPLSEFSFWCIAWVVEGIVWIILAKIYRKRHPVQPDPIEPPDLEDEGEPQVLRPTEGQA